MSLLLLPTVFGQQGGATAPPSTGGAPGGNAAPGGNGPGVGRVPFPTSNNSNGQYPGRPIFLTGRVMLEDGTPPPRPAAIERVCGTYRRIEGHTDSKGYFSIQLGKDRKSTRLNSSHRSLSRMPSSA